VPLSHLGFMLIIYYRCLNSLGSVAAPVTVALVCRLPNQKAYKKISAIIKAKRPKASVKAKPRIAVLNNSFLKDGLREVP